MEADNVKIMRQYESEIMKAILAAKLRNLADTVENSSMKFEEVAMLSSLIGDYIPLVVSHRGTEAMNAIVNVIELSRAATLEDFKRKTREELASEQRDVMSVCEDAEALVKKAFDKEPSFMAGKGIGVVVEMLNDALEKCKDLRPSPHPLMHSQLKEDNPLQDAFFLERLILCAYKYAVFLTDSLKAARVLESIYDTPGASD